MSRLTVLGLRIVIGVGLAGSLLVQGVLSPLIWLDMEEARTGVRVSFVVIVVLGVMTLQVTAVCVWRLLTMVRRETVFSSAAFGYVDVVIGAMASASVLVFATAVLAAYSNRTSPGDNVAPGLVGVICGVALLVGGVALIVLVLRMLLAQAVLLDTRTRHLQSELDEVI